MKVISPNFAVNFPVILFLALSTGCKKTDSLNFQDIFSHYLAYPGSDELSRIKYLTRKIAAADPANKSAAAIEQRIRILDTLAEYGGKKGWLKDKDVARKYKQAVVRRFIEKEFEEKFTAEQIPAEFLKRAYKANYFFYNQPELVKISHILVRCTRIDDAAKHQQAFALAGKIKKWVQANKMKAAEFRDLVKTESDPNHPDFKSVEVLKQIKASGLTCIAEALDFFAWPQMEKAFAAASFALKKYGDVGGVIQTRYGYHVIFFEARRPPFSKPYETVIIEIREKIFPEVKRLMFLRFIRGLRQTCRIELRAEKGSR